MGSAGEAIGHSILGTQEFIPKQFAGQISLDMNNAWGILRVIVDRCMQLKDGKYVLYKEPGKGILRIYKVPLNTFEDIMMTVMTRRRNKKNNSSFLTFRKLTD